MDKDKKVISLEAHRRKGAGEKMGRQGEGENAAPADLTPLPGRLIWLHCPTCNSLEYTELPTGGGRVHNACGTQVEEAEVELDLRGEYTLAGINLDRLNILEGLLNGQRQRYEEYRKRLSLAAGRSLEGYPANEETTSKLPIAEVDAFGLLVSHFFQDPSHNFPGMSDQGAPETDASGKEPKDD